MNIYQYLYIKFSKYNKIYHSKSLELKFQFFYSKMDYNFLSVEGKIDNFLPYLCS